jgi:hypothetical protein
MHGSHALVSRKVRPPRTVDTLALAMPATGDSLGPLLARVREMDNAGDLSEWAESRTWWLHRHPGHEAEFDSTAVVAVQPDPAPGAEPPDIDAEAPEPGARDEPRDTLAVVEEEPSDTTVGSEEDQADEPAVVRPELRAGSHTAGEVELDGVLSEPFWATVDSITNLITVEPEEGGVPAGRTTVKIVVSTNEILVGARCYDPDPTGIVSFSKARDSELDDEDHILLVLDTFQDGRTGYVFAVNPSGARFDGLVSARGEDVNSDWDTIWEARTSRDGTGWSAEVRIPIKSLSFSKGLLSWGFNVQRRVQRLQETSRWSGASQDNEVYQTSLAGQVTDLGQFDLGRGLTIRPALIGNGVRPEPGSKTDVNGDISVDVTQRLGPNLLASLTVNTDFAETEVDARQTNLTRFDVLFPEKRTFFLEGADIFEFGLGLDDEEVFVPFFTRRIGLFGEEEELVESPVSVGGKVNGRLGNTNVGAMAVRTGKLDSLGVPSTVMGAVRVAQNILDESTVGFLGTFGDPRGADGRWTAGVDLTYRTSEFWGDKSLLIGVYGLANDRRDPGANRTAVGGRIEYPNDRWDFSLTYARIGEGFKPSLGFVPRSGQIFEVGLEFGPRPRWELVRQMFFGSQFQLAVRPDNKWDTYAWPIRPLDWQFESGDRIRYMLVPHGERLTEPFEISDGVAIPTGVYHWTRQEFTAFLAEKREISGEATFTFGDFYRGRLNTIQAILSVKPWPSLTVALGAERNDATLPQGDFTEELYSGRVEVKPTADFQLSSLVQYDNESRSLGTNTRLRWTFHALGDLFVVYNHNMLRTLATRERFEFESSQLLVKIQYAFRY